MPADTKKVFVAHGRNEAAREAVFSFVHALGLQPLEFADVAHDLGNSSAYVGDIVRHGFEMAQAAIVLFTPDEITTLHPSLIPSGADRDGEPRLTARPNVVFEAGMALAVQPERTILVRLGPVEIPTNLGGRHLVQLNDTAERRTSLKDKLVTAKCAVKPVGTDWLRAGAFSDAVTGCTATRVNQGGGAATSSAVIGATASLGTPERDILLLMLVGNREAFLRDRPREHLVIAGHALASTENDSIRIDYLLAFSNLREQKLVRLSSADSGYSHYSLTREGEKAAAELRPIHEIPRHLPKTSWSQHNSI